MISFVDLPFVVPVSLLQHPFYALDEDTETALHARYGELSAGAVAVLLGLIVAAQAGVVSYLYDEPGLRRKPAADQTASPGQVAEERDFQQVQHFAGSQWRFWEARPPSRVVVFLSFIPGTQTLAHLVRNLRRIPLWRRDRPMKENL